MLILLFALLPAPTLAGQVELSCDFRGIEGVADVQIKREGAVRTIELVVEGSTHAPLRTEYRGEADFAYVPLDGFPFLAELSNPRIVREAGGFVFHADGGIADPIDCAELIRR